MMVAASSPGAASVAATKQQLHRRKISDEQQIRARLLNRLGIYDAPVLMEQQRQAAATTTAAQTRRLRILRGMGVGYNLPRPLLPADGSASSSRPPLATPYPEKLKFGSENNATTTKKKTSRIAFDDQVSVIPIPMRNEYSDRIRSRIWSNRYELHENAQRNAVEFAAEGWNWQSVLEDDSMYICSVSGELVHPVHCQHLVATDEEQQEEEGADHNVSSLERGKPVHE
jgi:hypothetical protein